MLPSARRCSNVPSRPFARRFPVRGGNVLGALSYGILCVLWLGTAPARGDGEPPPAPTIHALAITEPVTLDGVLDEPFWQRAEVAADFRQREPEEFEPATEPTEFRVVYTEDTLYFGIHAFDSQPDAVIAREMGRDARLFRDDGLVILLDTFHDRRNAYFFETNPNSSRTDGLVTDEGRDFSTDWDGIWNVRARRTHDGWTAEFAIPLRTLRFDPGADAWGLQIRRFIRRKNEPTFWAPIGRDAGLFRMSKAGELRGLEGLQATETDLRVKPFVAVSSTQADPDASSEDEEDLGFDAKWGVTRGLSLDLTVNTDFAETEVDEQQVNLTRFSLFFPEKREFFLENAGIFEFGPDLGPDLTLFFSRRIGIASGGRQVDLEAGLRLAGREGPWSIGLLGARTGGLAGDPGADLDPVPENDWGTIRIKRNVGERSNVGVLATSREGDDGTYNRVYGVDTAVQLTDQLGVWGFVAASEGTSEAHEGWSSGLGAEFEGAFWEWELEALDIDDDFTTDLGFVRRRGGQLFEAEARYKPRPAWQGEAVRNLFFEVETEAFVRQDGEVESFEFEVDVFGMSFDEGHFFTLFPAYREERLAEPFEIFDGVVIPAGEYDWTQLGIYAETASGLTLAGSGFVVFGDFYDGRRVTSELTLTWRPSRFFRSELTWLRSDVDLPAGDFEIQVWRQRLGFSITPDLGFDAFLQHNDARDALTMNFRVNWHYRPGSDLFLVYNQGWDAPSFSDLERRDRQAIFKATYLWKL
ncbi:MAG: DUF5916 domain-containing protein [Acidobacteriota bacterium]